MEVEASDVQLTKSGVKNIAYRHSDRVTDDAVLRVLYEEEKRIDNIMSKAAEVARHAGRQQTIKEKDVKLVMSIMGVEDGG